MICFVVLTIIMYRKKPSLYYPTVDDGVLLGSNIDERLYVNQLRSFKLVVSNSI